MAALSEFLSRLYALTKLFFALLYFDVVARILSIPGAFRRPKTYPMEATLFLELVEETIPTFRYTRQGAHSNECSVCLGHIGEGERAREFRCKHLFHRDCIDGWLKRFHATCPLCRTQVLPDEVVADFRNRVMFGRRIDEETTLLLSFLHAQAEAEEACNMRRRLNDEDYVSKPSDSTVPLIDANTKAGQTPKRTAAAIAAEVADKLTASSSSQMIMHSVLSSFAAEEAKNAGLTKVSALSSPFTSIPVNAVATSVPKSDKSMSVSDSTVMVPAPLTPATPSYQSVTVQQPSINPTTNSQAQYHVATNPTSQQYIQPPGGFMNQFGGYGSITPLPPGPPAPLAHMVSSMVPLAPQPLQITQQQPLAMRLAQQPVLLSQQQPVAPSFRPLQPPGMVYYGHPPHS